MDVIGVVAGVAAADVVVAVADSGDAAVAAVVVQFRCRHARAFGVDIGSTADVVASDLHHSCWSFDRVGFLALQPCSSRPWVHHLLLPSWRQDSCSSLHRHSDNRQKGDVMDYKGIVDDDWPLLDTDWPARPCWRCARRLDQRVKKVEK